MAAALGSLPAKRHHDRRCLVPFWEAIADDLAISASFSARLCDAIFGGADAWKARSASRCRPATIGPKAGKSAIAGQTRASSSLGRWPGRRWANLSASGGPSLLGRHHPQARFPLLLKFLDAAQTLSVQVHPDDARAAKLSPPDLGKTEAWVVLEAEPGRLIYAGLKPGVDRQTLAAAIRKGRCEDCLHSFIPRPAIVSFCPPARSMPWVRGLLVAEIQQSSDVTYRLFDWNRLGPDGQPRPLHVDEGLDAVDFSRGPVEPQRPRPTRTAASWPAGRMRAVRAGTAGILTPLWPSVATAAATSWRFWRGRCQIEGDPAERAVVAGRNGPVAGRVWAASQMIPHGRRCYLTPTYRNRSRRRSAVAQATTFRGLERFAILPIRLSPRASCCV